MRSQDGWQGLGVWEPWFVWYPLMINGQSVWLQTVERRYGYRQRNGVTERRWLYQLLPAGDQTPPDTGAQRE
jgi:hypothetical protein